MGSVIVPSWSVRNTVLGKSRASLPDASDAISCAFEVTRSRSGESRLRPPAGSRRYVHEPASREAAIVCASRSRSLRSQKLRPDWATTRSPR